jgi:hypothetical protein
MGEGSVGLGFQTRFVQPMDAPTHELAKTAQL